MAVKCPLCRKKRTNKRRVCDSCHDELMAEKRVVVIPLRDYWYSLIGRCYNEKWSLYKTYGAKGYTVHPDWKERDKFVEWGKRQGYRKGMLLIVEGLEYGPDTCSFKDKHAN